MHPPVSPTRAPRGAGFTLLELLVSIGIIAVLLGIMAPALRSARDAGRDAVCLSNLHQIATGWVLYLNENRTFPSANGANNRIRLDWDWGGVDWYDSDFDPTASYGVSVADNRPLNPYIGSDINEKSRAEIFRCPRDTGLRQWGTDKRYFFGWEPGIDNQFNLPYQIEYSNAQDAGESLYTDLGTSYRANDWIWVKPSFNGMPDETEGAFQFIPSIIEPHNTASSVDDPSRFILVGDGGPIQFGRFAEEDIPQYLGYGWWHGHPDGAACNMAFFDGSARRTVMQTNTVVTSDYAFPLVPSYWKPGGALFPLWISGYPNNFGDDDEGDSGSGG